MLCYHKPIPLECSQCSTQLLERHAKFFTELSQTAHIITRRAVHRHGHMKIEQPAIDRLVAAVIPPVGYSCILPHRSFAIDNTRLVSRAERRTGRKYPSHAGKLFTPCFVITIHGSLPPISAPAHRVWPCLTLSRWIYPFRP